uniref:Uncharacterized protein n=1 Tax=Seriola dumerili TaxID=41447 RepID=A0A3B4URE1_SERDU
MDRELAWLLCLCTFLVVTLSLCGPPGAPLAPRLPLIGSLLSFAKSTLLMCFFQRLQRKYGQTYSLMMGSHTRHQIVNQHKTPKKRKPRTVVYLFSNSGKDIAFGDYSITELLCMFGEGSASIEKISEVHDVTTLSK